MIPTRRTYLLLGLGLAIAVALDDAGLPDSLIFIVLVYFDLVIVGAAIVDSIRVQGRRVQVQRSPISRLAIGRDNPIHLTLENGPQAAEVRIYDACPPAFGHTTMPLTVTLGANQTQTLTYTVHPRQRGEYPWGDLHLRQRGPWQLAWQTWRLPAAQTVQVYPDLIGLRELTIRLTLQASGTIRRMRQRGLGTEFAELRDYSTGDDPRLIDWKATARRGQPLVRVLETEQEQTLIILLDRGRLMTARVQGLQRFDWGLNATLSLALAGLHRGDRVGVGVFDQRLTLWIPPERGQAHLAHILERLTPLQPELLEPDYVGAVTTLVSQQPRRALVVVITDVVDATASAELLSALAHLTPRYLPFCVTLRDPGVDAVAGGDGFDTLPRSADPQVSSGNRLPHPPNLDRAYARAVALDILDQRRVAFAQLRQRGVLVLDAPANQVSEAVVDRYLQLKARNQL